MNFFEPTDAEALTHAFPHLPFALKHRFAGNPLLTLPKLAELVRDLPRDRLEYNSGKAAIDQRPETTPTVDLAPEEIVHNIETAGAWMVLKSVEQDPAYRSLIDEALMEVARMRGFGSLSAAGFQDIRGFIFVSSANSTTPFHADADENFFSRFTATNISTSTTTAIARSHPKRRWRPARSSTATCPMTRNSTPDVPPTR